MNDPTTGPQGPQVPPAETALRDLVDHIPATIVVLADRPTVSIVYASAQIERLTGYWVKEWIDEPDLWIRSIHPADRRAVRGCMGGGRLTLDAVLARVPADHPRGGSA